MPSAIFEQNLVIILYKQTIYSMCSKHKNKMAEYIATLCPCTNLL